MTHPNKNTNRAIAFFDGQNLFHSVKESFGYNYPNYNPKKLARAVCNLKGWRLEKTCFYTGVPSSKYNPFWNRFWMLKLGAMRRQADVHVFSRPLTYRIRNFVCPHNENDCNHDNKRTAVTGNEKGIDVRIAIDVVSMAYKGLYDIALVFSQDQDLSEVADEIRDIAKMQKRFIKIASAFPKNPAKKHLHRGINKTDWIPFEKGFYDSCIDSKDYRKMRK